MAFLNNGGLKASLCVFAVAGASTSIGAPIIGGDPIYIEDDYFSADAWGLYVSSYVYDETSASLPGNLTLDPGEVLFVYVLDGDDAQTVSVDSFAVGNPYQQWINTVGWSSNIVPIGFDVNDHQEPFLFGYSGPSLSTIYTYAHNLFDPFSTLDPDEYSLVYYIAVAPGWTLVSATASGRGESDNQDVPGPVPEPSTVVLLCLALPFLARRR